VLSFRVFFLFGKMYRERAQPVILPVKKNFSQIPQIFAETNCVFRRQKFLAKGRQDRKGFFFADLCAVISSIFPFRKNVSRKSVRVVKVRLKFFWTLPSAWLYVTIFFSFLKKGFPLQSLTWVFWSLPNSYCFSE
jgi:hypothetical protein